MSPAGTTLNIPVNHVICGTKRLGDCCISPHVYTSTVGILDDRWSRSRGPLLFLQSEFPRNLTLQSTAPIANKRSRHTVILLPHPSQGITEHGPFSPALESSDTDRC